jgi:hypothetical protein
MIQVKSPKPNPKSFINYYNPLYEFKGEKMFIKMTFESLIIQNLLKSKVVTNTKTTKSIKLSKLRREQKQV